MIPVERILKRHIVNRIGRWSEANGTISESLSYLITETMRPEEEKT